MYALRGSAGQTTTTWILFRTKRYELHSRVTELGFLDPNLVVGELRMNEGRKLIPRPQLRQMHRGNIPSQPWNAGESPNRFLGIEALREGAACKRYQSE